MYLEVKNLKKSYGENGSYMQVLKGISTGVEKGEMCVIQGTSGSGKSTFLNCVGGLDTVESGSICVDGTEIVGLKQNELSEYRRANLGFIFQFYNILPTLTVKENVDLIRDVVKNAKDSTEILNKVGLNGQENKFPNQLSGGEQQRVSIARAIAKNPKLLLCDEPTGALDSNTGVEILKLLRECTKDNTVVIVTHNALIADVADRVIRLKNGKIIENVVNAQPKNINEVNW